MKISLLTGGPSLERDISFAAAYDCKIELESLGHDVRLIDVDETLGKILLDDRPDIAFLALHGRLVEDGVIQGLLEWMRIPHTHSGVLASALAMNKQKCKPILKAAGIPVMESVLAHKNEISTMHVITPPYVVKPANEGSSLGGLFLVKNETDTPLSAELLDREYYMVESYAHGRELTAGVLGNRKLAVSEFILEGELYDYEAKYEKLSDNRVFPAKIPDEIYEKCLDLAMQTHIALGCSGLTRTDLRWDDTKGVEGLKVIELNNQPGLRKNSNAGQQAKHVGISFRELCNILVESAALDT